MSGMTCSVATCNSRFYNGEGKKVMLFSFPKDPVRQEEWVKRCQRQIAINPKNARICDRHFRFEDFEDNCQMKLRLNLHYPQRLRLKNTAIPSLHLPPVVKIEDVPSSNDDEVDFKDKYEQLLEENNKLKRKLEEQNNETERLKKKIKELSGEINRKKSSVAVTSGGISRVGNIFVAPILHIRRSCSKKTKEIGQ